MAVDTRLQGTGVGALLVPLLPGIGAEINGARLWVRVGPVNFQPGEAAKVLPLAQLAEVVDPYVQRLVAFLSSHTTMSAKR